MLEEQSKTEPVLTVNVLYDLAVIFTALLTYPIATTVLPSFTGLLGLAIRLLYWGSISVLMIYALRTHTSTIGPGYATYAVASGAIFFTSYLVFGGLIGGLGRSPYQFTVDVMVPDILQIAVAVLGIELLRYYMVVRLAHKNYPGLGLVVSAIIIASYKLTPLKLLTISLSEPLEVMSALSYFAIEFALGLLSGFLMLSTNSPISGLAFMATYRILYRVTPFLPDLLWYENIFLVLVLVLMLYMVTVYALSPPGLRKGTSITVLFPVFTVAVAVWLSQGVLGVYLYAITSTSMTPNFDVGDLVVVLKTEPSNIDVGDIIVYKNTEGVMVAHRVIDIIVKDKKTYYITKGDAVPDPDPDPVPLSAVAGKAVYKLPKLGWVSIMFRKTITYLYQLLQG